jgi:hypothetical protein
MANTMRKNTDAGTRAGAVRSSDETLVMRVERRSSVIRSTKLANPSCGDEWLELAKLARRDRQHFDCATWLHRVIPST